MAAHDSYDAWRDSEFEPPEAQTPEFKPMLAVTPKLDKDGKPALRFPLYVQPKLDGIRASVVGGKLLTRTLKQVPNREIFDALSDPQFEGLDGELIVGDPTAEDCYRKTASFCMSGSKTGTSWTYYVFDKWDAPGTFVERYKALLGQSNGLNPALDIQVVPTVTADDGDELELIEQAIVGDGHEGAIARQPSSRYKFGRASKTAGELVKLKRFEDAEARVVGVYEELHNGNAGMTNALGRTERSTAKAGKTGKGRLGGFIVSDIETGVEFRVGTGFSAVERADLWTEWNQKSFAGRVLKYKHFPVGAHERPRHPVALGWRDLELDG